MSEVEIRQTAALEGQRGSRRGQEGQPAPPYRASWSTVTDLNSSCTSLFNRSQCNLCERYQFLIYNSTVYVG